MKTFQIPGLKYLSYFFALPAVLLFSCSGKDDTRGDEEETVREVHQESRRKIDPSAIALPAGMKIEAVAEGLSYPVDVTFDDKGNTYIAEAGGHTYGTKPDRAPEARILQLLPDGTTKVLYDKVVPMNIIKSKDSSEDMEEGLYRR